MLLLAFFSKKYLNVSSCFYLIGFQGALHPDCLESEGIPVMVQQGAIGILYSSSELSETKILVPFSFKEKVLEILSFYEKYPKDKNEENNNE